MVDAGIFDGDILVVDRAIKPRNTHIVVAVVDGEFTVKVLYQRAGRMKLKAASPTVGQRSGSVNILECLRLNPDLPRIGQSRPAYTDYDGRSRHILTHP
jgi:hypothetical protein